MPAIVRKGLFRIHAWLGLNLGLLLFVVCLSGTIAVFSPELDRLTDSSLRVDPPASPDARPIGWDRMRDSVARAFPDAVVRRLIAPRGDGWAARAVVVHGESNLRWVHVDPWTGKVTGQRSSFDISSFFRILHKQLYIVPTVLGIHGILVVGSLGIVLLASTLTGVLSYRRWWRSFVRLRGGRSGRALWSDLHRLAGVWALAVSLVLALTGIWYLAEYGLTATDVLAEDGRPPKLGSAAMRGLPSSIVPVGIDRAAQAASRAFPELEIGSVVLPARAGDPLLFQGEASAWAVRPRANRVWVNPWDGTVMAVRRGHELPPFERWVETADTLHFGTFGGLATRLLWCICGVLLCAGIGTGSYTAWLRLRQRGVLGPCRPFRCALSIAPTVAVLAACLHGTWQYGVAQQRESQSPQGWERLGRTAIGPWDVGLLRLRSPDRDSRRETLQLRFAGPGRPNFRRIALHAGKPGDLVEVEDVRRLVDRVVGTVGLDLETCVRRCVLRLVVEGWDGTRHRAELPLATPAPGASSRQEAAPAVPDLAAGALAVMAAFAALVAAAVAGWICLQLAGPGRAAPGAGAGGVEAG